MRPRNSFRLSVPSLSVSSLSNRSAAAFLASARSTVPSLSASNWPTSVELFERAAAGFAAAMRPVTVNNTAWRREIMRDLAKESLAVCTGSRFVSPGAGRDPRTRPRAEAIALDAPVRYQPRHSQIDVPSTADGRQEERNRQAEGPPAARACRPRSGGDRGDAADDGDDPPGVRALRIRSGRDAGHRIHRRARQVFAGPG